jgi:hypothetical protein
MDTATDIALKISSSTLQDDPETLTQTPKSDIQHSFEQIQNNNNLYSMNDTKGRVNDQVNEQRDEVVFLIKEGTKYFHGDGVSKDYTKAMEWYLLFFQEIL